MKISVVTLALTTATFVSAQGGNGDGGGFGGGFGGDPTAVPSGSQGGFDEGDFGGGFGGDPTAVPSGPPGGFGDADDEAPPTGVYGGGPAPTGGPVYGDADPSYGGGSPSYGGGDPSYGGGDPSYGGWPYTTPCDEPASASTPYDEPTSTPCDEPTSTPCDEPTSTPCDEPMMTSTPCDTETSAGWTTSIVYTTTCITITDCPATVTDCPARVTTSTIPWYTTVCPLSELPLAPLVSPPNTDVAAVITGAPLVSGFVPPPVNEINSAGGGVAASTSSGILEFTGSASFKEASVWGVVAGVFFALL